MMQFIDDAGVGALWREGADVQLVDHRLAPRPARPAFLPAECARIDDFARPVDVLRLEARSGIGNEVLAVDAIAVQRARPGARLGALVPAVFPVHGEKLLAE